MPARLGYGLIYTCIIARVDEDGRLKVDALLGDERAQNELNERRKRSVVGAGFEVG